MVQVASRASWGARHRDGDGRGTNPATEVFIHHTVTAHLAANATVAAEQAQMRNIEQIGQTRFGRGISYHAIIFPSGRAYQGVSWGNRGTQAANRNSTSRGIAFAGNYETTAPTDAAIATAAALVAHGRGRWWTQGAALRAHRDITATACPGRHVMARMHDIRSGFRPPGPTPAPPPPAEPPEEDDDMTRNAGVFYRPDPDTVVYLLFNTASGWHHEFGNGRGRGPMPGAYNNALAGALDTPSWAEVTAGHAAVIKRGLASVLPRTAPSDLTVTIEPGEAATQ